MVREILTGVDDVHFSVLTSSDVVRHRLVGDIVDAYDRHEERTRERPHGPRHPRSGGEEVNP